MLLIASKRKRPHGTSDGPAMKPGLTTENAILRGFTVKLAVAARVLVADGPL